MLDNTGICMIKKIDAKIKMEDNSLKEFKVFDFI